MNQSYFQDIHTFLLYVSQVYFDFDVVNLVESQTISTLDFITNIVNERGLGAKKVMLPSQQGDVDRTYADISHAKKRISIHQKLPLMKAFASLLSGIASMC